MNSVDYLITPSDEKRVVVRLRRKQWSKLLDRDFMATDLITTVPIELEAEIRADLEVYCQAATRVQEDFLEWLKQSHYTGRVLQDPTPETLESTTDETFVADGDSSSLTQAVLF